MLSSHVKISPLLWLHNKSRLSHQKSIKVKWFGISLKKYFTRVEKIFHSFAAPLMKYFSTLEEKFRISARPFNILYVFSQDYTSGMILAKVSSAKDRLTLTGISENQTIDITTLSKHLRGVKEKTVFRSRVGKTLLVGLTWTATLSCLLFAKRVEVTERYLC